MKFDIILAGVGGQGVLSVAAIIARGAMIDGLKVRQSEVHGMAQRGGAVLSHLRIANVDPAGDLVPKGSADLILSMEPLESLRYIDYLSPGGKIVTSRNPVVNIPDYPEMDYLMAKLEELNCAVSFDDKESAKEAGAVRATNMVMVGAAAPLLPIKAESLTQAIQEIFASKGAEIVGINEKAFHLGTAHTA